MIFKKSEWRCRYKKILYDTFVCEKFPSTEKLIAANFGLVQSVFYGMSTIVGYLMPNPFLYI